MRPPVFTVERGPGAPPLVATAVHDGHFVRDEVERLLAIDARARRQEEDPCSATWAEWAPTHVVARRSRFEVDLNRPRDKAVYLDPQECWGLSIWKVRPPAEVVERSLAEWDAFYDTMYRLLDELRRTHGRFLILELHSYNHRRGGPAADPDDPASNPDINVGTGTMDRSRWAPVVDRFLEGLRCQEVGGRRLDVRENVRFFGGHFPQWVHRTFPESGCALAIEVKKFFMDEWSGLVDFAQVGAIRDALRVVGMQTMEALEEVRP